MEVGVLVGGLGVVGTALTTQLPKSNKQARTIVPTLDDAGFPSGWGWRVSFQHCLVGSRSRSQLLEHCIQEREHVAVVNHHRLRANGPMWSRRQNGNQRT